MRFDDRIERHTELTCVFFFFDSCVRQGKGGIMQKETQNQRRKETEKEMQKERSRNEKI